MDTRQSPCSRQFPRARPSIRVAALAAALLSCTGVAGAADPLEDRFALTLGTYFLSSDTTLRVDELRGVGVGTEFEVEDVFHFDEDTVFRVEGAWRFRPRHSLRLMYFESDRTRTDTIDRNIEFGDESFPLGASATMRFEFTIMELAYRYAFLKRDNLELAGSFGVHNIEFKTALHASIASPGLGSISAQDDASTDAPLPVVGLGFTWRMGENIYLQAHAQYFQVKYGDIEGSLLNYQAGVLWQFSQHVGMGAAYNLFDLGIKADAADSFRGKLDWQYAGPQLYLRAAF